MARRFNRKPLTDEQRDARRKADRDRIEQAARALLTTDGWQRWIRVRASNGLSRYSVSNQMLIAIDCWSRGITPTYVAGFRAFLDLNRCVRKGETAIRILAPVTVKDRDEHGETTGEKKVFFRTVAVFDVSMTDPLPGKQPVPLTPPAEPITGDSHHHLIARLIAHAAQLGYTVEIRELPERRARRLVRPQAPRDRRRQRTRQPAGPHAHPRTGPRARPRLRAVRPRAGRGPGRLRDLLRARLRRPRRRRRVDPLRRRLGRRRRARRDPRIRADDRHDRPAHRRRARPEARAGRRRSRSRKCWRRSRAGAVGGCVPR